MESRARRRLDGTEISQRTISSEEALAKIDAFAGTAIIGVFKKLRDSPKAKIGLALWILGFSFMVFAPPLVTVTPEMKDTYGDMVSEASNIFNLDDAKAELAIAQSATYDTKVWFWRFRSPHKELVEERQAVESIKQQKVDELLAVRDGKLRKANNYVGIWSEYGMQDVRESFWSAFESGKVFAIRQTFWQTLMRVFSSREEYILSAIVEWILMALINFTLGLIGSLFYFTFSLGSLVMSYEPSPLSGIAFYAIALLGGASLVAAYLFALYGMAAGAVYGIGKFAISNALKYDETRRRRLQQPQQQQHHHHQE